MRDLARKTVVHHGNRMAVVPGGQVVVSEGELQVEMDLGTEQVRRRVRELADKRLARVLAWSTERGVPVLPLTTAGDVPDQVRRLPGGGPLPGRP